MHDGANLQNSNAFASAVSLSRLIAVLLTHARLSLFRLETCAVSLFRLHTGIQLWGAVSLFRLFGSAFIGFSYCSQCACQASKAAH